KEGKVAAQQPPPGSDAEAGDVLSVVIFGAPKDVPEVPNLIGLSLEQATQLLKDLGLPYKENRGRAADKAEDVGLVYEQTPELGARIDLRSGTVMLIAFGPLEQAAPLTDDSRKIPSELYVACQSFFPKLPDELPEGQKYRDWIRSQAADKVQLVPTEAPVFLRIDQAALQSYDLAWFARGQRLACPVQVTLADKKTGKRVAVDGALLLQVMGSYSSYDTFIKDYPKEKFADEGEQISFLHFRSSNGVFDDSTTPGAQNISYRGGPLQRGWAPNMQAANFSLFRGLLDYLDCFVATAVFASWDHPNVKALREFRDLALQNDPLGRRLIHAYYRIGPRLAEKVRAHPDLLRLLKQTFSRFAEIWTTEPAKAEAFARSHYERALVFFDAMETSLSKAITIDPFKLICDASATGKAQQGTLADEYSPAKQAALTGDIYFYGQGVPVDYPKALDWYLKAAELGSAEAMNNVAYIYEKGLGIQQDLGLAAEWYQKAAEAGLP
ncbi:MAG: SEL1-like repeat protein, partial [Chlamydiia bacterium]|nr:SEL1-like repeat protein [Chlamydiia bacterium]